MFYHITLFLLKVAEALNYLHSRQFIYRDLKPENVLVWKYPRPETQWLPDVCVFVKLADYGISKQITPQGIRGVEGTRPYLPPEVILHGGREAYSTKLDVYGYGMFMYFLVSFRTPFDSGRPITSLLEEGKRPELSPKVVCSYCDMFFGGIIATLSEARSSVSVTLLRAMYVCMYLNNLPLDMSPLPNPNARLYASFLFYMHMYYIISEASPCYQDFRVDVLVLE